MDRTGILGAESYLSLLKSLLPRGHLWAAEKGTLLHELLYAWAQALARVHMRAYGLLDEADPRTTVECIEDWERVLGLPETCSGSLPETLQQRRNAVLYKLTATGGQSKRYFIDIAAAHGFPITITEFFPWRCGISKPGDRINGDDWHARWQVNAAATTVIYFRCGLSRPGERIAVIENEGLECLIRRLKPAHTEVMFHYA